MELVVESRAPASLEEIHSLYCRQQFRALGRAGCVCVYLVIHGDSKLLLRIATESDTDACGLAGADDAVVQARAVCVDHSEASSTPSKCMTAAIISFLPEVMAYRDDRRIIVVAAATGSKESAARARENEFAQLVFGY